MGECLVRKVDDVAGGMMHGFSTVFAQVPQEHRQARGGGRVSCWWGVHTTALRPTLPALLQWLEMVGNGLCRLLALQHTPNRY